MDNRWLFFNKLKNLSVVKPDHDKTGSLQDAVIDLQSGEIVLYTLSSGSFLGIGGDRMALPAGALQFAGDEARLNVDEARFEHAPGTATPWPEHIDSKFIDDVNRHYRLTSGYKNT
ncbi:PRC-barrel domain-containing protein [Cesiribacter sp. SM1]|uniref:PRC-barrel domain-containing protein n=1 Tax=Cesiribacter sp. SM1 TaxID=2861196 RepID=UPI001CD6B827|nr:PRC-barrel domain-containing protein [Cesiribacter sp. SM1]